MPRTIGVVGKHRNTKRTLSAILHHPVLAGAMLVLIVRLLVFFGTMVWPISNEGLHPISPLAHQRYLDFSWYLNSLSYYQRYDFWEIFDLFIEFYKRPFSNQFGHIIAGPVFPILITIFEYSRSNTLPLAFFYLFLECAWCIAWLWWFSCQGLGRWWIMIFAIMPNPIWFMLVISPDLVFAALIGFFYFVYFSDHSGKLITTAWLSLAILILLTRPNGYSIILFIVIDSLLRGIKKESISTVSTSIVILLILVFSFYLYPYFITEMRKVASDPLFFNIPMDLYLSGMFNNIPQWLNLILSWLLLAVAKVLYFVGLRPSYGATFDLLVLVRAAAGVILLPGFIWGLFFCGMRQSLFLFLFSLPILLGPTQDRYNLPIFPLLFLFGVQAYTAIWYRARSKYGGLMKVISRLVRQ